MKIDWIAGKRRMTGGLLAAIALLAGCDLSGEYERRFAETLKTSADRAVYDLNLHPTETDIPDATGQPTGVKLRLPLVLDNQGKSLPPTEARAQPPIAKLPGLSYAIERLLDDAGGQFAPTYAYFAAVPKAESKAEEVQASVANQVAAAFPGTAWTDAQIRTPSGETVTYKRIRVDGQMDFDNAQSGGPVQKLDGRFDLYFIPSPNHHILIGWRAPKAQATKYLYDSATEAAMGTVVVPAAAPPANAAPPAVPAAS